MNIKKEILIGIVLIIVAITLYSLIDFWTNSVEQADITEFIVEDLQNKHPDADDITILFIEKKINNDGEFYYEIKAKVTIGIATPCPVRIHYYYNFPEQNFVTQPAEYITEDCIVCKVEPCTLTFEEEAIIASHTLEGTEAIHNYIENTEGAYPSVTKIEDGWLVKWSSAFSTVEYEVEISSNGEITDIDEIIKEV